MNLVHLAEYRCPRCRYDLTGLPGEDSACPECGIAVRGILFRAYGATPRSIRLGAAAQAAGILACSVPLFLIAFDTLYPRPGLPARWPFFKLPTLILTTSLLGAALSNLAFARCSKGFARISWIVLALSAFGFLLLFIPGVIPLAMRTGIPNIILRVALMPLPLIATAMLYACSRALIRADRAAQRFGERLPSLRPEPFLAGIRVAGMTTQCLFLLMIHPLGFYLLLLPWIALTAPMFALHSTVVCVECVMRIRECISALQILSGSTPHA